MKFCYWSLAHADLKKESRVRTKYEEEHMEVTPELLYRWALDRTDVTADGNGHRYRI